MEYARRHSTAPVKIAAVSTVTPTYPNDVIEMPNFATDSAYGAPVPETPFKDSITKAAAEDSKVRGEGLDTLSKALTQNLPDATVAELLHSLCQPLLRRFEDPVEKLREKAIRLMAELCRRVKDLQPHLPYLFPVRGSA